MAAEVFFHLVHRLIDAELGPAGVHSITVEYDPDDLRARTLDLAAMLFATGLDPDRSTVFVQSHVPAHAEAAWLLSSVTSFGELRRMTQFKEKGERQEFVSAALFTYPVLMAGDILLYQADIVPIGDDQRQHLELARDIARALQHALRRDVHGAREAIYPGGRRADHGPAGARPEDVDDRRHAAGDVRLLDPPEVVRKKFRSAVTDSGTRRASTTRTGSRVSRT